MKKLYPCMVCEKRYAEIEQAEVCERKHDADKIQRIATLTFRPHPNWKKTDPVPVNTITLAELEKEFPR